MKVGGTVTNIQDHFNEDSGQALIEYALVLVLVALGCVGTLALFSAPINAIFQAVANGF
jgi:Flp pilus assembly pilin Flp